MRLAERHRPMPPEIVPERSRWRVAILLAGGLLGAACGGPADVGGRGERSEGAVGPVMGAIRVAGTPYELGWRQGQLLAMEIRTRLSLPIEADLLPALSAYAREMRPLLPVVVEEELRGIAAGSHMSADELFLREVAREGSRWHDEGAPAIQASLVIPPGPIASVLASYDAVERIPAEGRWVVLERHPRDGAATIGLAWPGSLGLFAGLSSTGLLAAEAEVPGVLAERRSLHGMPFSIGLRVALERAQDARDLVGRLPRLVGNRVAVADAKGSRLLGLLHLGVLPLPPTPSDGWAFAPAGAFAVGDAAWKRQEAAVRTARSDPSREEEIAREILLAGGAEGATHLSVVLSATKGMVVQVGSTTRTFAFTP